MNGKDLLRTSTQETDMTRFRNSFFSSSFVLAVALSPVEAQAAQQLVQSGSVTIDQGQAGFMVTAGYGGGVLRYKGKAYRFEIGGLGLGGIGASSLKATGAVYNLQSIEDFPGPYVTARTGAVIGNKSIGKMWLTNSKGVTMALRTSRKGLMLSTGADTVVITMK